MKLARILLVEDEALVALDIERRLASLGYRIAGVAATGADALDALAGGGVDLVLMDIRLRGESDGIEAAQRVRDLHGLPVVFLTGHADEETLRRARHTDPEGFLVKPFKAADLRAAIEVALHRHATRRRLLERARWFAHTLAAVGDGVIAADAAGLVVFHNEAAERLTGWSARDAAGRSLETVFRRVERHTGECLGLPRGLSDPEATGHAAAASLDGPGGAVDGVGDVFPERGTGPADLGILPLGANSLLVAEDGRRVPLDGCVAPIRGERSERVGCVLVFRDASERVEAEAERHRSDRRGAEARAKSGLVERLARSLRPELGAVLAWTELLAGTPLDAAQRELVGELARSATYLAAAAEEALDGRSLETGELLLEQEPFDLCALTEETAQRFARLARERGLDVVLELEHDLPEHVLGDPARLTELLGLFLRNALDHTTSGHVSLSVSCAERGAEEALFHFRVRDTGDGIEPQRFADLFDLRESGPAARRGGAPGLVLARRLVELMGGSLSAQEAAGGGSQFGFHLPLELLGAPRVEPLVLEDLAGLRVLVADASPTAGRALARHLAATGALVECVDRGDEAEARVRLAREEGEPFAAVCLQADLPGCGGVELCQRLLEEIGPCETSFVLASAREADERLAVELGVSAFVLTPAGTADWLDTLAGARARDQDGGGETWTRRALAEARRAEVQLSPEGRRRLGARVLLVDGTRATAAATAERLAALGASATHVADRAGAERAAVEGWHAVLVDPRLDGFQRASVLRRLGGDGARPVVALAQAPTPAERVVWRELGYAAVIEAPPRSAELQQLLALSPDPAHGHLGAEVLSEAALAALDEQQREDLVAEFFEQTRRGLDFLRGAAEARDVEALRWVASSIRSHSERLGAPALEQLCERLCALDVEESIALSAALIGDLEDELDRVRLALLRRE